MCGSVGSVSVVCDLDAWAAFGRGHLIAIGGYIMPLRLYPL